MNSAEYDEGTRTLLWDLYKVLGLLRAREIQRNHWSRRLGREPDTPIGLTKVLWAYEGEHLMRTAVTIAGALEWDGVELDVTIREQLAAIVAMQALPASPVSRLAVLPEPAPEQSAP